MSAISYILLINNTPAPSEIFECIQQIEVEDHADMADILRLKLSIAVKDACGAWNVLDDDHFNRLTNIKINITVDNGVPETLISAYVIETNANISNQPGQSVFNVVAMDPSIQLNLEEKVRPWTEMSDSIIATTIFGEYGYMPVVEQTQPTRMEINETVMQRGTDIQFLQHLAKRNGYEVYIEVNPLSGIPEGHFHPPRLEQKEQGVLTVNMGESTNINSFTPKYDMLKPTKTKGKNIDVMSGISAPPIEIGNMLQKGLGAKSLMNSNQPRVTLINQSGFSDTGELQTYLQAVSDRSSWAITANGELNTVAYGGILRAKRTVNVRGAGIQFSGTYYVERVHHVFSGDSYTQSFTLRRNAMGLTGQEQFIKNNAL